MHMPATFDEREKSFEAKWVRDQELRFKVYSRRNRMLGLWAAGEIGLKGADADAYAGQIVATEFEKGGEDAIFGKIRHDFDSRGISQSDHTIRRKMADLLDAANAEIERESRK
jgi:hypothetical protein